MHKPAFPLSNPAEQYHPDYRGMDLRDYFAAKIAPVLMEKITPAQVVEVIDSLDAGRNKALLGIAQVSYAMADALVEVRDGRAS